MYFVMLTSQLRECKQMEGCVPKGGTAPRVIAIAKLVSLRIFICECSQREKARVSVLSLKDRNAVANALSHLKTSKCVKKEEIYTPTPRELKISMYIGCGIRKSKREIFQKETNVRVTKASAQC